MSYKFDNLSKFTEDVTKYFQDHLHLKLRVKIADTKVILKKIQTE